MLDVVNDCNDPDLDVAESIEYGCVCAVFGAYFLEGLVGSVVRVGFMGRPACGSTPSPAGSDKN